MNRKNILTIITVIVASSGLWLTSADANQKILVEKGICFNKSFISPNGETVVYTKTVSKNNVGVYAYNINDGTRIRLNSEESIPYLDSMARGATNKYACWLDSRNATSKRGGFDIYISDLSSGTEKRVTTETSGYWNVTIKDSWVCWLENIHNPGIYAKNIDKDSAAIKISDIPRKTTTFYDLDYINGQPIIYWEAKSSKGCDIFMYNLQTMETSAIGATDKIEISPKLHNGVIYYTECNSNNPNPVAYMKASGRIIGYNLDYKQKYDVLKYRAGGIVYPVASSKDSELIVLRSFKSSTYTLNIRTMVLRQISSGYSPMRSQSFDGHNFIGSFKEEFGSIPEVKLYRFDLNTFENLSDIGMFAIQPCIASNIATWTEYNPYKNFSLDLWLYKF